LEESFKVRAILTQSSLINTIIGIISRPSDCSPSKALYCIVLYCIVFLSPRL